MAGERRAPPRVVIVGAGLAGISTAIAFKRQLPGFENFTIYEKHEESVGGTWRDNTYPGCGSDVPGHWYSLSTDLNPNWSSYYVSQPEIRAYWAGLWTKHDLAARTVFGTLVYSAEWDADAALYRIVLQDTKSGEQWEEEANVLIYAIGGFQQPMFPTIDGIESFKGAAWHAARYRHDVDLRGKRVAVIGNGCTGAQLVPSLAEDPEVEVLNFCRTPQWYIPSGNFRYPRLLKWIFANMPFVMRVYRNSVMARSDLSFLVFRKTNRLMVWIAWKELTRYLKSQAPKDQWDQLIPNYTPGCKRIIVDPGYLASLHKPNVSLCYDEIDRVVENGIQSKNGEVVPLDVIIFATGFSLHPVDLRVRGRFGTTLFDYFELHGGATAYLGSAMPGFPNLYVLLGPNVATGHASVIFSEEAQINLAIQLIKPIIDGQARAFEIKEDAMREYDNWVQTRLKGSVWTECQSYYHHDGSAAGRIVATWPGPVTLFWWMTRTIQWKHWKAIDADDTWVRKARSRGYGLRVVADKILTLCFSAMFGFPNGWY